MAKFAVLFSYNAAAWKAMIDDPNDRVAVVRELAAAGGGTLEHFYWMLGDHDGIAIFDFPDSASAAAASVAVSAGGAVSRVSTHELIDADGRVALLRKAKEVAGAYRPPG